MPKSATGPASQATAHRQVLESGSKTKSGWLNCRLKEEGVRMIVILDNIRSCHNVGSIFRTADAAGCEKIYLGGITPGPVDKYGRANKRLAKVSLGAEKSVVWEQWDSTLTAVEELKSQGYKIISLEQSPKSISIFKAKLAPKQKYALALGEEVNGLSQNILDKSDLIVEIPMSGKKESLNVAVAFGVAVFQLLR